MSSRNYIMVDLDKIRKNIKNLKSLNKTGKCFFVVKANAYGLGALEIAKDLEDEADAFCVALPEEAAELREGKISKPILSLGYLPDEWMDYFIEKDISATIYNVDIAKKYDQKARDKGRLAKIHLKIDTGQGRLGFQWNDEKIYDKIGEISQLKNLKIEGTFSHLASADADDKDYTNHQIESFKSITDGLKERGIPTGIRHLANDAGLLLFRPDVLFDGERLGISVYGQYPSKYVEENSDLKIEPVFSWHAAISNIKWVEKGTSISYGRTWIADKKSKIATIQIGYADGYPRALSNKANVLINGKRYPQVGRVCMDQMMVDITGLEDVEIGDEALLIGKCQETGESINADELADLSQTISYEIMTDISPRVERRYKGGKR